MKALFTLALSCVLAGAFAVAQAPAPAKSTTPAKTAKAAPAPAPTAAEISDAKAKGMVWANLNTKVYHMAGASTYGTTKNGKFMTEADAKAAGFRAAKEPGSKSAKPAPSK